DQQVLPHLYAAGELGHIGANQYNGGGDIADCLIFGKIAGENAAKPKENDTVTGASEQVNEQVDSTSFPVPLAAEKDYPTSKNQYIGKSSSGMGNEIVVRVTVDEQQKPAKIEVLKESESPDYGGQAIKQLQKQMVKDKTANVDVVSGATSTSRAFKEAVSAALKQAK
ncbi:MAG: FMN-binding protein, partial [Lactobacillus sp.]|nr:FMN-binding protein [Lactobacillus sp.]